MGLTRDRRSERPYATFGEIGRMISRSAFNQLNHSALLLSVTILGLLLTYVLPVALLFSGDRPVMLSGAPPLASDVNSLSADGALLSNSRRCGVWRFPSSPCSTQAPQFTRRSSTGAAAADIGKAALKIRLERLRCL